MRFLLTLTVLSAMSFVAFAQPGKEGPIPVIKVELKEPISYEKHIEPIFYNDARSAPGT